MGPARRERVAFEVATNPGAPPGRSARIASGGELSRFMLALKVVLAASRQRPTLVFDEVDSGIGGAAAAAVGERLQRLAGTPRRCWSSPTRRRSRRAAHITGGSPRAQARPAVVTRRRGARRPARREEIARMLSGAAVTDEARAAADRLMAAKAGA